MSGGHMHSMLCALYGVEAGPIRRGLVAISPVSQRVTRGTHGRVVARNVTLHAGLESCGCIRIVSLTPKLRLHPLRSFLLENERWPKARAIDASVKINYRRSRTVGAVVRGIRRSLHHPDHGEQDAVARGLPIFDRRLPSHRLGDPVTRHRLRLPRKSIRAKSKKHEKSRSQGTFEGACVRHTPISLRRRGRR